MSILGDEVLFPQEALIADGQPLLRRLPKLAQNAIIGARPRARAGGYS